jgi:hypothetical protein
VRSIIGVNDDRESFDAIRALIRRAREIAQPELAADTTARPAARNLDKAMDAKRHPPRQRLSTGLSPAIGENADQYLVPKAA